jgi:DNA primase
MQIHKLEFNADVLDILHELRKQLRQNQIDLLHDIKDGPSNVQVTCIYHSDGNEKKPSAGIKKDTGVYHCFACGESHDLPEFISNCFGRNDLGAFGWQWLMQNFYSVEVEDRNVKFDINRSRGIDAVSNMYNGNNNDSKSDRYISEEELDKYRWNHPYWRKRGITDESIIELFDLGYDKSTQSITFPVRDIEGHCLFVARRSVRTKFFNYPEGVQKPLYGLYELSNHWVEYEIEEHFEDGTIGANNKGNEVIVCESMIDCILLWQEGHYAVALNGLGNQLQMQQLRDLPCRRLILATDNDNAGYSARDRIRSSVKNKIITEIQFPDDVKDIGECTKDEIKHILDWEVL